MYMICIGAIDMGFEFIGPFESKPEADHWAARHLSHKPYGFDILKLRHPSYAADNISKLPKKN